MPANSIALHRVLRSTPQRIYRAFLDADAWAKWLPPHGFIGRVHQLEPKVGGTYRMSFTNLTTGHSHAFGGEYRELIPNEKLRYTARFDDPNLPGVEAVPPGHGRTRAVSPPLGSARNDEPGPILRRPCIPAAPHRRDQGLAGEGRGSSPALSLALGVTCLAARGAVS